MRNVARTALVFGTAGSAAAAWRLSVAFATEMDRRDVSFFALLFWAGLVLSAAAFWGMLALRRLGERSALAIPFEAAAMLLFGAHLLFFAYMRIPAVRTVSYGVSRWVTTYGMSREVPLPARNVPSGKP